MDQSCWGTACSTSAVSERESAAIGTTITEESCGAGALSVARSGGLSLPLPEQAQSTKVKPAVQPPARAYLMDCRAPRISPPPIDVHRLDGVTYLPNNAQLGVWLQISACKCAASLPKEVQE